MLPSCISAAAPLLHTQVLSSLDTDCSARASSPVSVSSREVRCRVDLNGLKAKRQNATAWKGSKALSYPTCRARFGRSWRKSLPRSRAPAQKDCQLACRESRWDTLDMAPFECLHFRRTFYSSVARICGSAQQCGRPSQQQRSMWRSSLGVLLLALLCGSAALW